MEPLPAYPSSRKFATVKGVHSSLEVRPDGWLDGFVCVRCAMRDFENVWWHGYEALYRHLRDHRQLGQKVPVELIDAATDAMTIERHACRVLGERRPADVWLTRRFLDRFAVRDLVLRVGSVALTPVTDDHNAWHPPGSLLLSLVEPVAGLPDGFRLGFSSIVHDVGAFDPADFLDRSKPVE